jgi:predicted RNase H-like nuclease
VTLLCELCDGTVTKKSNGLVMAKPTDKELLEIAANESTMTGPGIDQKIIRRVIWEYYSGSLKALFEDKGWPIVNASKLVSQTAVFAKETYGSVRAFGKAHPPLTNPVDWEQDTPRSAIFFGFDSAWTDNPKAPGAICAVGFDTQGHRTFWEPQLVSFAEALQFIKTHRKNFEYSLVALDQPSIVPNQSGSRPVDKVAASLVSFIGGGVQPANRGKVGMFCDASPVWSFLSALGAVQDPMLSREASNGLFLIEVFPALALPSLNERFAGRLSAPKYNPQNRKKFSEQDWQEVIRTVSTIANNLQLSELAEWADGLTTKERPRKGEQDKLDAAICLLVGILWRLAPSNSAAMIGSIEEGYMISPISEATRPRLSDAAKKRQVAFTV